MCIRHHTNCSVESVSERGAPEPSMVLSTWKRSSSCRNFNSRVCPGHRGSGDPVWDVLKHETVKPPLLNKKWDCLKTRVVQRNDPDVRALTFSLPHPRSPPTRTPKKNHPQPTQNRSPIKFSHYLCATPGTDPMDSPHPRIQCNGPLQMIHTQNQ